MMPSGNLAALTVGLCGSFSIWKFASSYLPRLPWCELFFFSAASAIFFGGGAISYSLKMRRPWRKFNHLSWQHNERVQDAVWSAWQLLSTLTPLPYLHLCWHLSWSVASFMTLREKQKKNPQNADVQSLHFQTFPLLAVSFFLSFLMQPRPRVLPSPFPPYPVSHCSFLPRSLWSLNLARDSSGGMSSCVAFWGCPQCLQEVVHSNLIFMVWAFLLDWKRAQKFSASSNLINNKYRPALLCALRKLEKPFLHLFYLPWCSLNPYFTLQVIIES